MDSSKPVSRAAPPLPDSKVKRRRRSQPRLASFTDVTASPAQRVDELERWVDHQVIDKGSVVFEQVASRHVPGALPRLATEVGKLTPEGGLPPALADEWWAGLIPSDVTIPVSLLDTWLAQSTAAERRQQVTAAAGVGHAIIEVEKAEVGQVVFKPDTQAALRKLLLQTVSTVLTSLDVEGDTALTERLVAEAIERTRAELLETAATPEAEAALGSLIDDTVMASKLIGDLLQLFGAAKSSQMPPDKRIAMLRDTATELGPVYVKLCQSVVNQISLIKAIVGDGLIIDDDVLAALGSLQDSVPPMPPEEVPQRIRDAFGMEPDEVFVSFELEPFASASIGQLHHATLRDPETGELYEAAVKLQRYGLLDALEPTLRTARLVSAVTAEVIRTGPGFEPEKRDELIKIVEMVDRTLEGFVKTFEVETDYLREAKTMRDYAGVVDGFAGIRVPQVYDSHSNGTVLAMELVKGERLDALLARYEQAHAARQQPASEVRLRKGSEDADALAAASQFAERAYGLTPVSSRVVRQRRLRGREVELFFDHKSMPSVRVKVDRNGRVKGLTPVAELTPEAIDKLRARLASWFVSSPLQSGTMHGDIHQGNFFILPDLSVTIIDYGMMLDIGKRELWRVAHFVSAGRKQSAAGMAAELVHMLEGAPTSRHEVRELKKRLRVSLERELAVVSPTSPAVAFVAAAFRAAGHEGMQIDPLYLQLVKTASSMGGNLAAFEASSDVPGGPREVISDVVPGAGKNLLGTFVSGVGAHRAYRKEKVLAALRTQFATPRPDGP